MHSLMYHHKDHPRTPYRLEVNSQDAVWADCYFEQIKFSSCNFTA
uniref:Uncharacterized protein n=1 Tax=Arundo donax TaxID=35708 RepID=A0A0A8ZWN6_ARUDO